MSDKFCDVFKGNVLFALSLYKKYLEICPEEIWQKEFGRWPVGEQFYHGISASAKMLAAINGASIAETCPKGGELLNPEAPLAGKEDAAKMLEDLTAAIAALDLDNAALLQKNEAASQMFGREMNAAAILGLMSGHLQYHLGSCDSALRQAGLAGAF